MPIVGSAALGQPRLGIAVVPGHRGSLAFAELVMVEQADHLSVAETCFFALHHELKRLRISKDLHHAWPPE